MRRRTIGLATGLFVFGLLVLVLCHTYKLGSRMRIDSAITAGFQSLHPKSKLRQSTR
jgi:hypothetical protein